MSDIFLSYSRDDQATARRFAECFGREGFDVWWDQALRPGEAFDEVTEAALRGAKAVVVLWSKKSVGSRWVRAEATQAQRCRTLVPAMIEACERPIMFELVQTAELGHWRGEADDPAWRAFLRQVRAFVEARGAPGKGAGDHEPGPLPSGPAILVLPFVNMSADPEQEYFSDGVTEDVITDLSKVSALAVTARNTAFAFKGKYADVIEVARQLRVSHVLEGSVRKSGTRVRITAQLIDGATGNHLWAERYDRDLSDIFTLQDEIAQAIVSALKLRLLPEEKKAIEARRTTNVEAYKLYLMARQFLLTGNVRHRPLVIRLCERAAELDPDYAQAWALLAIGRAEYRLHDLTLTDNGWAAADRALALDPHLAEAHAAKGRILADQGRFDDALKEHDIAVRLDPNSYDVNCAAARCYMGMGRYDEALRHFEKAALLVETEFVAASMEVSCRLAKGDREGAVRAARRALTRIEKIVAVEPDHGDALGFGVGALVALGEKERAQEWAERAMLLARPDDYRLRYNLACGMAQLGDADFAVRLIEPELTNCGRDQLRWIESDPDFDPVRDDAGFKELIAKARARLAEEPAS